MSRVQLRIALGLLWCGIVAAAVGAWLRIDLDWDDIPELIQLWLSQFGLWRAAAIFFVIYLIRPLILFPAGVLTVSSGLIFGPWLGIVVAVAAENASALVAFLVARFMGREWVSRHERGRLVSWDERISHNAIMSVVVMRLVMLPFDLVNYGCGLTAMRKRDFLIGTAIGIMPSLVSFVLIGGAGSATGEHRSLLLGLGFFFLAIGFAVARQLAASSNGNGVRAPEPTPEVDSSTSATQAPS